MDFWSNIQVHKWPSAAWILLYAISLILLFRNRKKWGVDGTSMWLFLGISVVLYYCPFFAKIMVGSFLPSYLEYERVSWLLFINPVCAFAMVKTFQGVSRQQKKRAIVLFAIGGLLISNVNMGIRNYALAENGYKVPDDVVTISEALIEDSGCDEVGVKPTVFVQEDADYAYAGNAMYHGIRQYTSGPILTKVVIKLDTYEAENFNLLNYSLMNYAYFVCHNVKVFRDQAESAGFTLLVETEDYCLYKNDKVFSFYFVRHGQTDANVAGIYAGSGTDAMLTEEGIAQASSTGEALADVNFTDVYTSEMTRAKDTAEYVLNGNENGAPEVQTNVYLNDFYWGDMEGLTAVEVAEAYPDFTMDGYIGTATDSSFVSPVNAWSKSYMLYRYRTAFLQIAATASNNGNVLAVGHSAMAWYLQSVFPNQVSEDAGIDNASITVLHYDRGTWTLEYFNLSAEEYEELGL